MVFALLGCRSIPEVSPRQTGDVRIYVTSNSTLALALPIDSVQSDEAEIADSRSFLLALGKREKRLRFTSSKSTMQTVQSTTRFHLRVKTDRLKRGRYRLVIMLDTRSGTREFTKDFRVSNNIITPMDYLDV